MAQESKIEEILAPYGAFITYVPLRTEVPFRDYMSMRDRDIVYEIAPRASLNPAEEAEKTIATIGERKAAILIPGRSFDASGTRHGQGGGWYDRFLALVPRGWFRMGFCYERQFSATPLVRESWDQEMDVVCVVTPGGLRVITPSVSMTL